MQIVAVNSDNKIVKIGVLPPSEPVEYYYITDEALKDLNNPHFCIQTKTIIAPIDCVKCNQICENKNKIKIIF